jgi:hypothetical protein
MKAKTSFRQESKLEVAEGDTITVIDGNPERYWWKGQNNRTMLIGHFPRAILDPKRRLTTQDISKPLRNSFVHTGHMSAKSAEKSWGHPGKIDDIFLRNPLNPPDLLDDINENESSQAEEASSTNLTESLADIVDSINLIDLSDECMRENEINVYHPNYFKSLDPILPVPAGNEKSADSYESTSNNNFPTVPYFKNLDLLQSVDNSKQLKPHTYYNDFYSSGYENTNYHTISKTFTSTNPFKSNSPVITNNILVSEMRNSLQSNPSSSSLSSFRSFMNDSPVNNIEQVMTHSTLASANSQPVASVNKFQFDTSTKKATNVDDLLSKVMNDVILDFDKIKSNMYK